MTTSSLVEAPPRRPPRQPRNHVALILSLVSGFGHLYLDHYLLGAALFAVFVTALNGVFLGFTLQSLEHPQWVQWTSILVGVVTWVGAFWHCWLLSYGTDRFAIAHEKERLLREGLLAYLRDELEQALSLLERAVELDIDWEDPDPLFHLGVVTCRMAERRARRGDSLGARTDRRRAQWAFRTCLQRDPTRKWAEEIQTELKRMRRTVSVTGRLRPLPGAGQFSESTDMLPRLGSIQMPMRKLEAPAPTPARSSAVAPSPAASSPAAPSPVETVELEAKPKPKIPEPNLPDQPRVGAGRRTERTSRRLVKRRLKRLLEDDELEARAAAREALARSGEILLDEDGEDRDGQNDGLDDLQGGEDLEGEELLAGDDGDGPLGGEGGEDPLGDEGREEPFTVDVGEDPLSGAEREELLTVEVGEDPLGGDVGADPLTIDVSEDPSGDEASADPLGDQERGRLLTVEAGEDPPSGAAGADPLGGEADDDSPVEHAGGEDEGDRAVVDGHDQGAERAKDGETHG